jgi:alkylation response protein AidB-like acyl-CoA dehydrogenase
VDQASLTLVDRARDLADTILAPAAEQVDIDAVIPTEHFDALADAGLFGILGPRDAGGSDLSAHDARRVIAAIAGGCGATFFVWVQHHGVVRALRNSPNTDLRGSFLAPLCVGEMIAGVAFAHARRMGPAAVRATRVAGGWQFDGFAPWTTSWGIAQQFVIVGESDTGELVWVMVDESRTVGITPRDLQLPVLAATRTVALEFNGFVAPDAAVMTTIDGQAWRVTDRFASSIGQTAALGVAERAVSLLDDIAERGDGTDVDATAACTALREQLDDCWAEDDRLVSEMVAAIDDREAWIRGASLHRARCLELARTSTTALLAASGGRGLDLSHPAQRLAREAMFYVIQAQTADGRSATLHALTC